MITRGNVSTQSGDDILNITPFLYIGSLNGNVLNSVFDNTTIKIYALDVGSVIGNNQPLLKMNTLDLYDNFKGGNLPSENSNACPVQFQKVYFEGSRGQIQGQFYTIMLVGKAVLINPSASTNANDNLQKDYTNGDLKNSYEFSPGYGRSAPGSYEDRVVIGGVNPKGELSLYKTIVVRRIDEYGNLKKVGEDEEGNFALFYDYPRAIKPPKDE